ncbi:MAG: signal peptidase I [Tumebacillaceae bacterium]
MNHFEQKLTSDPTPGRGFTEEHKRAVLARIRESKRPKKLRLLPWAGGFAVVVMLALLVMTPQLAQQLGISKGEITDATTPQTLQRMTEVPPTMLIHETYSDAMIRGGEDMGKPVVTDPAYYKSHAPARGDVVLLQQHDEVSKHTFFVALRVVALPGERVKVDQGQVYINGKKLNTFYGREYHNGLLVEDSEVSLSEREVPEGHVYVMPDNWWRYRIPEEPLAITDIIGKVVGYKP